VLARECTHEEVCSSERSEQHTHAHTHRFAHILFLLSPFSSSLSVWKALKIDFSSDNFALIQRHCKGSKRKRDEERAERDNSKEEGERRGIRKRQRKKKFESLFPTSKRENENKTMEGKPLSLR
jgi:hypothetical protein